MDIDGYIEYQRREFCKDLPCPIQVLLDAETEHALFVRYSAAARAGAPNGRITVLVSHRFSTVRMAEQIVVLDESKVVEAGTHEELMAKRGHYAELYGIQAAAYR